MIQVYADGKLAFDNRLDDYDLQGLKITTGLRIGGTAEIVMPPHHPAYSLFTGYRTVVEIYRDNVLRFRGRALYPVDDFNNQRTVVCEGEFCFLQDGISRPYLYQTDPAAIFAAVINEYNAQVEPFKRFKVGEVTVTDPNDYIRLESSDAETVMATVNKLIERCGGYVVFTTDESGERVINWLAQVGKTSSQIVELGENLFDVSRTGANTDLATAVIPYGAKDETTGERLTVASVNDGKDYIVDEEAAALRGTITKAVIWDDVTTPENLLRKARQYLDEHKLIITSLSLTALDLSYVDRSIDSYEVGDLIHVQSKAHLIDDDFQLVEHSEDLLNPANSNIVLGKEITSLTRLDAAGKEENKNEIKQLAESVNSAGYVKPEQLEGLATTEQLEGLATTEQLAAYQTKEDELLQTVSKTIVGAINELNSKGGTGGGTGGGADGVGIASIELTGTDGLVDTYTITLTDGRTVDFTVTNGEPGKDGTDGTDGKSAYDYAKDGGYTGAEAEFAEKLAAEWQLKTDNALETESKDVVDAINEVNEKIDALNGLPNSSESNNGQALTVKGSKPYWTDTMGEKYSQGLGLTLSSDGTYYILTNGAIGEENVKIPPMYNGLPVTEIDGRAFSDYGSRYIDSIEIPNTITKIGDFAFGDCEQLEAIFIPASVVELGDDVFKRCEAITIYCEIEENQVPDGWHYRWNDHNRPVVWGVANNFIAANKKINEVSEKTVDKVATLDTWYGGIFDVDYDDNGGVNWKDEFALLDDSDNEIKTGTIAQKIPIVAGENVTFENDGYKVKINASGGGLPSATVSDSGKFLRINAAGQPEWQTIPRAEEATF